MTFDLDEINDFMANYEGKVMPESVRRIILSGEKLAGCGLESVVIEWRSLERQFSPKIAAKIEASTKGKNVPVLKETDTPNFYVYHPENGEYLGHFYVQSGFSVTVPEEGPL
ncbi:MAG: hypothetical protein KJ709_04005 [Nanoarchaeota archaeon]|nr:hypothetical protein [Nanoarchaeota archaeon]